MLSETGFCPTRRAVELDRICVAFEEDCLSGVPVTIEEILIGVPTSQQAKLIGELIRVEAGVLENPPSPEDYADRFPAFLAEIQAATQHRPLPRLNQGDVVGPYTVEKLIGVGAFGHVYRVQDSDEQVFALKVKNRWFGTGGVQHETAIMKSLLHPNIMPLCDYGEFGRSGCYIVMPLMAGGTLRHEMARGRMGIERILEVSFSVLEALTAVHQGGVIHCDFKPTNIFLDSQRKPLIGDFGLSLVADSRTAGTISGSLKYMSPEQIRGESQWLDGRTDVWSFGVVLYEMLTGVTPFCSSQSELLAEEILHRDPRPVRELAPQVPSQLESICLRCLGKRASDRYAVVGDVLKDLASFRNGVSTNGVHDASSQRPHRFQWFSLLAILRNRLVSLAGAARATRLTKLSPFPAQVDLPECAQRLPLSSSSDSGIKLTVFDGKCTISEATRLRLSGGDIIDLYVRSTADVYVNVFLHDGSRGKPLHVAGPVRIRTGSPEPVDQLLTATHADRGFLIVVASIDDLTVQDYAGLFPGTERPSLRSSSSGSHRRRHIELSTIPYEIRPSK